MKNREFLILAAAAAAAYFIVKKGPTLRIKAGVTEITNPNGTGFSNGWRYFSDGTSIDPQGNYYLQGQLIYTADGKGGATPTTRIELNGMAN